MTKSWRSRLNHFLILNRLFDWFSFGLRWIDLCFWKTFPIGCTRWFGTFLILNRGRGNEIKIDLIFYVIFDRLLDSTFTITLLTTVEPGRLPRGFSLFLDFREDWFLRVCLFWASLPNLFGGRLPPAGRFHNFFHLTSLPFHSFNFFFILILFFLQLVLYFLLFVYLFVFIELCRTETFAW